MQDPPLENPVDPLPVYTPGESLGRSVISLAALPPAAPEGAGAIWFSLALLFMVVRLGGSILRAPAA